MSDENAEQQLLSFTKQAASESLLRMLDGLTTNTMRRYPEAERQSWDIQKIEAEAMVGAGDAGTLATAPFLTRVCAYHHGDATPPARLVQVKNKAAVVLANANNWAEIAAFVNGVRARTEDAIEVAQTAGEVSAALSAASAAVEGFRQMAGL